MPEFGAQLYVWSDQGRVDHDRGGSVICAEAATAQEAAEAVCGVPLADEGPTSRLRATVWDRAEKPIRKQCFYLLASPAG